MLTFETPGLAAEMLGDMFAYAPSVVEVFLRARPQVVAALRRSPRSGKAQLQVQGQREKQGREQSIYDGEGEDAEEERGSEAGCLDGIEEFSRAFSNSRYSREEMAMRKAFFLHLGKMMLTPGSVRGRSTINALLDQTAAAVTHAWYESIAKPQPGLLGSATRRPSNPILHALHFISAA